MQRLKIMILGSALGVHLPNEVLKRLNLGRGDTIYLTEAAGGYRLTPFDPGMDKPPRHPTGPSQNQSKPAAQAAIHSPPQPRPSAPAPSPAQAAQPQPQPRPAPQAAVQPPAPKPSPPVAAPQVAVQPTAPPKAPTATPAQTGAGSSSQSQNSSGQSQPPIPPRANFIA
jgi:hypothetical protein